MSVIERLFCESGVPVARGEVAMWLLHRDVINRLLVKVCYKTFCS